VIGCAAAFPPAARPTSPRSDEPRSRGGALALAGIHNGQRVTAGATTRAPAGTGTGTGAGLTATPSQRAGSVWIQTSVSRASRATSVTEGAGCVAWRMRSAAPMTRRVLGQRPGRSVLVHVQERVLPPARLHHDPRRAPRRLHLDRRLAQRPPTPLQDRLPQPTTVRTTAGRPGRLTKQPAVRESGSTPGAKVLASTPTEIRSGNRSSTAFASRGKPATSKLHPCNPKEAPLGAARCRHPPR
jgi:hypothetical protein